MFARHRVGAALAAVLPDSSAFRLRAEILRRAGWPIGAEAVFASVPKLVGSGPLLSRLSVGENVFVNIGAHWELNERIDIADHVSIGHEVMLLTTTHRIGTTDWRAADLIHRPIRIERGAWIGARSLILPGVTVGAGAIVAAGTVVTHDVPPDSVYGTEGAMVRRSLEG